MIQLCGAFLNFVSQCKFFQVYSVQCAGPSLGRKSTSAEKLRATHPFTAQFSPLNSTKFLKDSLILNFLFPNNRLNSSRPVKITNDCTKSPLWWANSVNYSGGIFMFGMNNDVIGNHVVGHEHGLWTPGASQPTGRPFGFSLGKVRPMRLNT
jgi:histidinol dehydrogenase